MATEYLSYDTYNDKREAEFKATLKVTRTVEELGQGLKALGLKSRWSIRDPKALLNMDPTTMEYRAAGDAKVNLLFKPEDMELFNEELRALKAMKEQQLAIKKLRAESPEFDALWKEVEFTLLMAI